MTCTDGRDRQSKLSQQELIDLQKATHFDKKELQQWYKGTLLVSSSSPPPTPLYAMPLAKPPPSYGGARAHTASTRVDDGNTVKVTC